MYKVSSDTIEEDESDVWRSSGNGLFLLASFSCTSGSIELRVRSCQPF